MYMYGVGIYTQNYLHIPPYTKPDYIHIPIDVYRYFVLSLEYIVIVYVAQYVLWVRQGYGGH